MPASKIKFGTGQHRKTINLLHKMTYYYELKCCSLAISLQQSKMSKQMGIIGAQKSVRHYDT